MLNRFRTRWAFIFGKLEHRAGRVLGLLLVFSLIDVYLLNWVDPKIYLGAVFVTWLIYILSHTLEKTLFGNNGPRQWGRR